MQTTLSPAEMEQRRTAIAEALVQVRLEGLEPAPLFFALAERYIRGEITLENVLSLLLDALHVNP